MNGRHLSHGHGGSSSSVVIDDRHVVRVPVAPDETDPPLVVDADAVLAAPIATEFFQAIPGRDAQVVECFSRVARDELTEHRPAHLRWVATHGLAGKEAFGVTIAEALDPRG